LVLYLKEFGFISERKRNKKLFLCWSIPLVKGWARVALVP
jgi:hypothetical protein